MKVWCIIFALLYLNLAVVFAQPTAESESTKVLPVIQIPTEAISPKISPVPTPEATEIEIKRSSEATRIEGCKDLCGDGICQEVVCMALGCPCPETPKTCPQDCKISSPNETKEILPLPVIALPTETKVEIVPTRDNPISVNDKPIKFTGIETTALPKISVEVETVTPGLSIPVSTNVEIDIDKENKIIKIEHENISAVTKETIKIEEKTIKIETPNRDIQVDVLPAIATQVAISKVPQEIQTTELKVIGEKPVYEIEGIKTGKLLWLIPINFSIQTHVDAQTREIIKMEKPWWSFLVS
jgi:hypothetical protein